MGKRIQILVTLAVDLITICFAWLAYYAIRVQSGWIHTAVQPDFLIPMISIYGFWAILFYMAGLHRPWYAASRFDELALLFKTLSLGCLFLFFAIFVDDQGHDVVYSSRLLILIYWAFLLVSVSTGRLVLRSVQRRLLIAGVGVKPTIIVGSSKSIEDLRREIARSPELGYRIVGSVLVDNRDRQNGVKEPPILGGLDELHDIISTHNVKEVLIALDSSDHGRLLDIIAKCNSHAVGLKIVPDLYDIVSGQARINPISGFPLIEISPQLMSQWEEALKRIFDVVVSLIVLAIGLPFWVFTAILIKVESSGPVFYRQERVGRNGERFSIIKFRSMWEDAERGGPQWAHRADPRITRVGKWLRKLHVDEVPQMFNVITGHMSLVGPRPERPVFVESLSKEIPLYSRRLRVRPGITGWAQVKHRYDETIDDVKMKVQHDLYYIENMSLRMDMKILFGTVSHMLLGKGR